LILGKIAFRSEPGPRLLRDRRLGEPEGPIEVLLVNGNNRQGLAVARSLAHHGVSFALLSPESRGLSSSSRAVKYHLQAPVPLSQPEPFVGFLSEAIQRHQIRLAIPASDQALVLFERFRDGLESRTRLAMAGSNAVRQVLDKRLNLELARQLEIPCPRQFDLRDMRQIPEMIRMLGFPIVLKRPGDPTDPNLPAFKFRVLYAHNEQQLRAYIEEHCREGVYTLFQECAAGDVHNLCCFAAKGELVAIHEYHSIRRKDGVGVLRRIVAPLPDLVEHARGLLRARCNGMASPMWLSSSATMARRSGTWKPTDAFGLRPRVQCMQDGISLTGSTDISCTMKSPFPEKSRSEVLLAGTAETSRHCSNTAGGESPTTGTNPGKVLATFQYLSGFSPFIHSDVFHWNDPMPGVMEHWEVAAKGLQYLKRKRARPGEAALRERPSWISQLCTRSV
jgi:hypothetical protein